MESMTSNYVKCEKCGITRNIVEAPVCPICKNGKPGHSGGTRAPNPDKIHVHRIMCGECGFPVVPVKERDDFGNWVKCCPNCHTELL